MKKGRQTRIQKSRVRSLPAFGCSAVDRAQKGRRGNQFAILIMLRLWQQTALGMPVRVPHRAIRGIVRQRSQKLRQAALSGLVVAQSGREGRVAEGLGEALS